MNEKAVITGATGYIGSNLLKYLLSQGWDLYIIAQPEFGYSNIKEIIEKIHIIEYNKDINTLITFFKETNPEVVFHLAASVMNDCPPDQISTIIQSNVQFGTEVLEAMAYSNTRIFINTGTYWQNYDSDQYSPVNLYAATKEAFEKILKYYVDALNFRAITLRLFDIYGENDNRPKLINLLYKSSLDGSHFDLSPGEQVLDFVHIHDVCVAYQCAYELLLEDLNIKNEVYGVYSGERVSIKTLVELFEKILNTKLFVNFGGKQYKNREIMIPCKCYSKLPNWTANISLMEGLKRFKSQIKSI